MGLEMHAQRRGQVEIEQSRERRIDPVEIQPCRIRGDTMAIARRETPFRHPRSSILDRLAARMVTHEAG